MQLLLVIARKCLVSAMDEWSDVRIPELHVTERAVLEGHALFFLPLAASVCSDEDLNVNRLNATSMTEKAMDRDANLAGRSVIRKVMRIEPVTYQSALGFINAANIALRNKGVDVTLTTRNIIACVFRLKDGPEIINEFGITDDDISVGCGVKASIVRSAIEKYRIQYADAHKIWLYLRGLKRKNKSFKMDVDSLINDDERAFIKTDDRHAARMAIKQVGEEGEDRYVYRYSDLQYAPLTGHYWSLE